MKRSLVSSTEDSKSEVILVAIKDNDNFFLIDKEKVKNKASIEIKFFEEAEYLARAFLINLIQTYYQNYNEQNWKAWWGEFDHGGNANAGFVIGREYKQDNKSIAGYRIDWEDEGTSKKRASKDRNYIWKGKHYNVSFYFLKFYYCLCVDTPKEEYKLLSFHYDFDTEETYSGPELALGELLVKQAWADLTTKEVKLILLKQSEFPEQQKKRFNDFISQENIKNLYQAVVGEDTYNKMQQLVYSNTPSP